MLCRANLSHLFLDKTSLAREIFKWNVQVLNFTAIVMQIRCWKTLWLHVCSAISVANFFRRHCHPLDKRIAAICSVLKLDVLLPCKLICQSRCLLYALFPPPPSASWVWRHEGSLYLAPSAVFSRSVRRSGNLELAHVLAPIHIRVCYFSN